MPAVNFKTIEEKICEDRAMDQWRASLKRPDLSEEDRVRGAIEAYQRQAYAFTAMQMRSIFRHKKRGTVYEVISFGRLQAADLFIQGYDHAWRTYNYKQVDMIEVVIYRNVIDEQEVWVRPSSEFYDGRFESIEQ